MPKRAKWKELPILRLAIEDIKRILDSNLEEKNKLKQIEKIIKKCKL